MARKREQKVGGCGVYDVVASFGVVGNKKYPVNDLLRANPRGDNLTMSVCVSARTFFFTAGHLPPLLMRSRHPALPSFNFFFYLRYKIKHDMNAFPSFYSP